MTTDLEGRLRQALRDDAQRARLVNPLGPPAPDAHVAAAHEFSAPDIPTVDRRIRRRRVLAAAAAIVVVIAGAAIAIGVEDSSRVSTKPTPTTSGAIATVQQYRSVVADNATAIQGWIHGDETCTDVECSFPQYYRERYLELRPLLGEFQRALAVLPAPPNEIRALVDRTKTETDQALERVEALLRCGARDPYTNCAYERDEAKAAYERLPAVFATWSRKS